jgi:antitoxin (DNA-binding transcriptional repressor) of toxin-antitoxin stability system
MIETPISVTLASRRFSDCINRVRYHGASFLLEKNGVPVARIVPVVLNFNSEFEQPATTLRQARQGPPEEPKTTDSTPDSRTDCGETKQNQEPVSHSKRPALNW